LIVSTWNPGAHNDFAQLSSWQRVFFCYGIGGGLTPIGILLKSKDWYRKESRDKKGQKENS
jgi:hypothetical protein